MVSQNTEKSPGDLSILAGSRKEKYNNNNSWFAYSIMISSISI